MHKTTIDHNEIRKASAPDLGKEKEDDFGSQRVYKKTSPNSALTLYLGTRDIICRHGVVEPLRGVVYIDPKYASSHKIFGQLTLTFRYGREDEEVMGLKFCNEAIIALRQIWPVPDDKEDLSPLQKALLDRLGKSAYAFSLEVGSLAPPSVQLVPAKRYTGAPIGTSYDVRVHLAEQANEHYNRRSMVRLGVRVIHKISSETKAQPIIEPTSNNLSKSLRSRLSPKALKLANKFSTSVDENQHRRLHKCSESGGSMPRIDIENNSIEMKIRQSKGPECSIDKPFLWTEGRVSLRAALDKSAYVHGEHITVTVEIRNDSRKIVRKIRIIGVQHVDVCMFSNGKFKNIVADVSECNQIKPGESYIKPYKLLPAKGSTKNWIAVEGTTSYYTTTTTGNDDPNDNHKIASSAPRGPQTCEERNVFAIYVSYYVKVKLTLSGMGGEVSLKLPFILGHVDDDNDDDGNDSDAKCSTAAAIKSTQSATNSNQRNIQTSTSKMVEEEIRHNDGKLNDETPSKRLQCSTSFDRIEQDATDEIIKVFVHENVTIEQHCGNEENIIEKIRNTKLVESRKILTEEEDVSVTVSNVITAQIHHQQQQQQKQTKSIHDDNNDFHVERGKHSTT